MFFRKNFMLMCYNSNMKNEMEKLVAEIEKCREVKNYDGIFNYAIKLKQLAENENDSHYLTIGLYHVANCYFRMGDYKVALKLALDGIVQGEIESFYFYLIHLHNLVGILYGTMGDEINSVQHLMKGYYITKKNNETRFSYILTNNLGVLFFDLDFYDVAYKFYKESYYLRRPDIDKELNVNDGFNLVNLMGCAMFLELEEEYQSWKKECERFLKSFVDYTVRDDMLLYQAFHAFKKQNFDESSQFVRAFLDVCDEDKDGLHNIKSLLRLFGMTIEMKDKALCDQIKKKIQSMIFKYPEYMRFSKLAENEVKYQLVFEKDTTFNSHLLNYFYSKEEEEKITRENLKGSLLTRIEFEKVIYEQESILKKNEELRKNIELEEFTRTLNKASFKKYVKAELDVLRDNQYVGLFVIDIDKFKSINDTKGHLVGDQVLLDLVNLLKRNIRNTDYIGRIGGDEFCVFIKNVLSIELFYEKANRFIKEIRAMNMENLNKISVSIGIAITDTKIDYEDLFNKADEAMYIAKNNGGDQFQYIKI